MTALAHVIVTEKLYDEKFIRERCDWDEFLHWADFVSQPRNSPEEVAKISGVPAKTIRGAARLYATGGNGSIYYGLGVTEHSQGSTTVMAIANLAMATGNIGRPGVGVNPLRGQNNVQGSCDMGSFPHELSGYRHISLDATARRCSKQDWGVPLDKEPGLRIPNMLDAAVDGSFKGIYIQGEDILQSDPDTKHVSAGLEAMECVVVQDLFLNETARFAHVFLPGSTFLEKNGTFTNAERRIQRVRKVMAPKNGYEDWEITLPAQQRAGLRHALRSSVADHGRDRPADARLRQRVSSRCSMSAVRCSGPATTRRRKARRSCTSTASCAARANSLSPNTSPPTRRPARASRFFSRPAASCRSIMSARRRDAPTTRSGTKKTCSKCIRMTPNSAAFAMAIGSSSRAAPARRRCASSITDRVAPGVVYTTFHHPDTQANVITTEYSDWATNCPEYKVTAVQVIAVERTRRAGRRSTKEFSQREPAHRRDGRGGGVVGCASRRPPSPKRSGARAG